MLLQWFNLCHKKIFHEGFAPDRTEEKWSSGFPTRSDTNLSVQSQKKARSLKYQIYVERELYNPWSENKGADQLCSYCTQLCSYCTADLCLCFA